MQLTKPPGLDPGFTHRSIEADEEQWDERQRCPVFESCYRLCMAKVAEEAVVMNL